MGFQIISLPGFKTLHLSFFPWVFQLGFLEVLHRLPLLWELMNSFYCAHLAVQFAYCLLGLTCFIIHWIHCQPRHIVGLHSRHPLLLWHKTFFSVNGLVLNENCKPVTTWSCWGAKYLFTFSAAVSTHNPLQFSPSPLNMFQWILSFHIMMLVQVCTSCFGQEDGQHLQ